MSLYFGRCVVLFDNSCSLFVQLSDEHQFALMTITFFGCIISIICLLMSFITFSYFRSVPSMSQMFHAYFHWYSNL